MKRKTVIFTLISITTVLFVLILVFSFVTREENKNLSSKIAEQQKEIEVKDIQINLLKESNYDLKELADSQKRLIDGESLGEFMELYDSNKEASMIEVLVHLENSESGLPMRFLLKGSSVRNEQEEDE